MFNVFGVVSGDVVSPLEVFDRDARKVQEMQTCFAFIEFEERHRLW